MIGRFSAEVCDAREPRTAGAPVARGALVFTFDDGYPNWTHIADEFAARGQRATFAVTSSRIGIVGGVTASDISYWSSLGHEVASHGVSHTRMTQIPSAADRAAEYDVSRSVLESIVGAGKVSTWVYPHGSPDGRSASTDQECLGRYNLIMDTNETGITPIADRDSAFLVPRNPHVHSAVMDLIRFASVHPVIVSFYAHNPDGLVGGVPDVTMANLLRELDFARELGVPCLTASEAFPAGNMLANANFETGELGAWRTAGTGAAGAVEIVAGGIGAPFAGSFVARTTVTGASTIYFRQMVPVEPGKEYAFGFRARLAGGALGTIYGRLGRSTDYAGAVAGWDGATNVVLGSDGGNWVRMTSTFTVPAGRRFIEPTLAVVGLAGQTTVAEFGHVWFGESKFGNFG